MPLTSKDFDVAHAKPEDPANLDRAITYLNQSPTGSDLMQGLADRGTLIISCTSPHSEYRSEVLLPPNVWDFVPTAP